MSFLLSLVEDINFGCFVFQKSFRIEFHCLAERGGGGILLQISTFQQVLITCEISFDHKWFHLLRLISGFFLQFQINYKITCVNYA